MGCLLVILKNHHPSQVAWSSCPRPIRFQGLLTKCSQVQFNAWTSPNSYHHMGGDCQTFWLLSYDFLFSFKIKDVCPTKSWISWCLWPTHQKLLYTLKNHHHISRLKTCHWSACAGSSHCGQAHLWQGLCKQGFKSVSEWFKWKSILHFPVIWSNGLGFFVTNVYSRNQTAMWPCLNPNNRMTWTCLITS